jgi:hypothetical protein
MLYVTRLGTPLLPRSLLRRPNLSEGRRLVRTVALLLILLLTTVAMAFRRCRRAEPVRARPAAPATWRRSALLPIALVLQVAGGALTRGSTRLVPIEACYLLVLTWIGVNLPSAQAGVRRGLIVSATGAVLNMIPISLSGGMPVSRVGLRVVGAARLNPARGHLYRHVLGRGGLGGALGDVFGVSSLRVVVSVGDLVLMAGLTLTAYSWVRTQSGVDRLAPDAGRAAALVQ